MVGFLQLAFSVKILLLCGTILLNNKEPCYTGPAAGPVMEETLSQRYLFMVHVTYAFEILRPLQEAILRRGDQVAWFLYKVEPEFLDMGDLHLITVDEVRAYNPSAVFLPGNWVPRFFPGVKVQIFHGLANDDTGKKGHFRIRGLFDLYCTHAEGGTRKFQELADQMGHFRVVETGWPKLDPLYQQGIPPVRAPDPEDPRPVVLFGSTFSPSLTSAPVLVETIEKLSRTGRWRWLVTMHPKMDPEVTAKYKAMQGPNLKFVDSNSGVIELLQRADVMICDTSSILLEFMLLQRPVVTFNTKVPGPHVLNITRPEALAEAVERALTRPPELMAAMKKFMHQLHAYSDGRSSERILAATDDLVVNHVHKLKPKPLNPWRRLQMRWRLRFFKP